MLASGWASRLSTRGFGRGIHRRGSHIRHRSPGVCAVGISSRKSCRGDLKPAYDDSVAGEDGLRASRRELGDVLDVFHDGAMVPEQGGTGKSGGSSGREDSALDQSNARNSNSVSGIRDSRDRMRKVLMSNSRGGKHVRAKATVTTRNNGSAHTNVGVAGHSGRVARQSRQCRDGNGGGGSSGVDLDLSRYGLDDGEFALHVPALTNSDMAMRRRAPAAAKLTDVHDAPMAGRPVWSASAGSQAMVSSREPGDRGGAGASAEEGQEAGDGASGRREEEEEGEEEEGEGGSWCVYLLLSCDGKKTYVGVTTNLARR